MTTQEFSDTFDTLVNSYATSIGFGEEAAKSLTFDEYEKSVFLTKAQEELVISLYTGRNPQGEAFESTEEIRRYLSDLVCERNLKPITTSNGKPLGISSSSKFFTLPSDLWFITYESVIISAGKCEDKTSMKVFPVKQDEYQNIKDNPFRGANDRRALRLDLSEGNVEIVCKYNVTDYYIRYIRTVYPIILEKLPDGLTINGFAKITDSTLPEPLHQRILDRAVILALQSKGYNINNNRNS